MKGYKGFYPGLICEPDNEHKKQYAENTVYEEEKAECCKSGMHFCKYPLDVFNYYAPSTERGVSEYAEVEALDRHIRRQERETRREQAMQEQAEIAALYKEVILKQIRGDI